MHPFRLFVPPNRWSDLLKLSRYIVPRPAFDDAKKTVSKTLADKSARNLMVDW